MTKTTQYKVGIKNTLNNVIIWTTNPIDDTLTPYTYQQAAQFKAMLGLKYRNTIKEAVMEVMTEADLLSLEEV